MSSIKIKRGKLKLAQCLIKHQAMKTYVGLEVYLHSFLNMVLYGVRYFNVIDVHLFQQLRLFSVDGRWINPYPANVEKMVSS